MVLVKQCARDKTCALIFMVRSLCLFILVTDFLFFCVLYLLEITSFGYSVFNNLNELQLPNLNVGELCMCTNCCECVILAGMCECVW